MPLQYGFAAGGGWFRTGTFIRYSRHRPEPTPPFLLGRRGLRARGIPSGTAAASTHALRRHARCGRRDAGARRIGGAGGSKHTAKLQAVVLKPVQHAQWQPHQYAQTARTRLTVKPLISPCSRPRPLSLSRTTLAQTQTNVDCARQKFAIRVHLISTPGPSGPRTKLSSVGQHLWKPCRQQAAPSRARQTRLLHFNRRRRHHRVVARRPPRRAPCSSVPTIPRR